MASIFHSFPMLRTAAPRLSRQFFTCQARQIQIQTQTQSLRVAAREKSKTSWILRCHYRYQTTHAPQHVSILGESAVTGSNVAKKSAFPKTSEKMVAYWLLGSAASVFGIVVWGGLTRLTESGYIH